MTPEATIDRAVPASRVWVLAAIPLVLLAGLLFVLMRSGPPGSSSRKACRRSSGWSIERAVLTADGHSAVGAQRRPGPGHHRAGDGGRRVLGVHGARERTELGHLGRTRLDIPYPWVAGEAHLIKVMTSTGTTFEHEIAGRGADAVGRAAAARGLHSDRAVRGRDSGRAGADVVSAGRSGSAPPASMCCWR